MGSTGVAATESAGAAVVSLRERKSRATRVALRRSAVALVAERGLGAVTVDDIAGGADVSPRTFYNYFPTKEDAISGWDPVVLAHMVACLRDRPADEAAPAALRATVSEAFSLFNDDHRDLLERLRVVRSDPNLWAHQAARWAEAERQLVAALAERRGSDAASDRYAALVVATSLTAGRVALMSWCHGEGQASLDEELAFCFEVLAGLAEPERSMR